MEKIQATQILVKDANLRAVRFDDNKEVQVIEKIRETNQKQADVLKLKEVSPERLNLVVRL
jgi:hypothetical protein